MSTSCDEFCTHQRHSHIREGVSIRDLRLLSNNELAVMLRMRRVDFPEDADREQMIRLLRTSEDDYVGGYHGKYWESPVGLIRRIESLSQNFVWKLVNNAVKITAQRDPLVKVLIWVTAADDKVCPICAPRHMKEYLTHWFLPQMPAHPGCRCQWEMVMKREEELEFTDVNTADAPPIKDQYKAKKPSAKMLKVRDLKVGKIGKTNIQLINKPTKKAQELIKDTLGKVPFKLHSRNLKEVNIINAPPRKVTRRGRTGTVNGYYDHNSLMVTPSGLRYSNQASITVYSKGSHIDQTLMHEIGHNVYNQVIPLRAKNDWDKAFYKSLQDYELPSDYAGHNASEGFAETYMMWYTRRDYLDPKIRNWIDEKLGPIMGEP